MKNYETEAQSRWGNTEAYREHEQKTKNYSKEKWAEAIAAYTTSVKKEYK